MKSSNSENRGFVFLCLGVYVYVYFFGVLSFWRISGGRWQQGLVKGRRGLQTSVLRTDWTKPYSIVAYSSIPDDLFGSSIWDTARWV